MERIVIILAMLIVLLPVSACAGAVQSQISSEATLSSEASASTDSPMSVPTAVIDCKEAFNIAADDYYAGNHFMYLYVTDNEGTPIPNLLLFSADNWFVRQQEGKSKTNGISMDNGLLPVYLQQVDLRGQGYSCVIANLETQGEAYTLTVNWEKEEFERLLAGEILTVEWNQPTPAQTAKQVSQAVDIYLHTADGKPVPNVLIKLEGPPIPPPRPENEEGNNDPRYTNQDGYVRLSTKVFERRLTNDQDFFYRILVQESKLVPYESLMPEFIFPPYKDGELCKEFRLVLPEE